MSVIPSYTNINLPPSYRPDTQLSTTSSMANVPQLLTPQTTTKHHLNESLLTDRIESAFSNRSLESFLALIHDEGVSVNYQRRQKSGNTPLILAVREGDEMAVVDLLDQCRADPLLSNTLGRTPLMCASASGMEHIITLLLLQMPQGAERMSMLFQKDHSGKNALDWARIGRRHRCISTLQLNIQRSIEYIRSERKEDNRKETLRLMIEENRSRRILIEHAILHRDTESVQNLAAPLKHANLTWNQSNKVMSLSTLRNGDFTTKNDVETQMKEEFLPSSTFVPNRPNLGKGIIVGVANRAALEHAVEEMMSDGGRIVTPTPPFVENFQNNLNESSNETSVTSSNEKRIVFAHPDSHILFADHECMGGITPLMYASGNDLPDLITLLVRRSGANVNLKSTRMGHTPLTWAACSGALSAVTSLLSEGAELGKKRNNDIVVDGSSSLVFQLDIFILAFFLKCDSS